MVLQALGCTGCRPKLHGGGPPTRDGCSTFHPIVRHHPQLSTLNNRVALLTCLTGLLLVSLNEIVTVPDENEDQDEEAEENS